MSNASNEETRQNDTMKRNQAGMEKEREAQALREENAALIERCQQLCDMAKNRTEHTMQERIQENQTMRKRLEQEVRETNAKIEKVKQVIADTKTQIRSLKEPMELHDTRDAWRKQRPFREQILDPVSTQMMEHKQHLINTGEQLDVRRKNEKQALADLEKRRAQQLDERRKAERQALADLEK